jgi:hypothetical protein
MGAGSSSAKVDAPREIGGIIDVGDSKKKIVQFMDLLFQQLLTATNPINFRQALDATGNGTCSGILVLLEPTIANEFQRLSFMDPETKQIVKSIFKGYDSIEDLSSTVLTKTMCKEITLFFLRLLILVGTCVLSVRPNKALTGLLGTLGSSMVEGSKAFQGIVKLQFQGVKSGAAKAAEGAERKDDAKPNSTEPVFSKLNEDPKDLSLKIKIKMILTNNDKYSVVKRKEGEYYVLVYKGKEYVLDLYNLVLYTNETDTGKTVGVLSISGSFNDPPEKKEESKRGGTRSHRERRGRFTRKMRGGVDIVLKDISTAKEQHLGEKKAQYYYIFNRTDASCNNAKPVRSACASSEEKKLSVDTPADEFVKEIIEYYLGQFNGTAFSKEQIDKYGAKIEPISGTGAKVTGYVPLTLEDKGTYARLQNLLESGEVGKLEEGPCFAVYRAYLLASGVIKTEKGPELKTYICHDKWAETSATLSTLPLFALLEQLYKDRLGNTMEPATAEKYNTFINKLTAIGTLQLKTQGTDQTFSNVEFKKTLCKKVMPGFDEIKDDPSTVNEVLTQYKQIAASLVKLIDNITKLLDKIIDFPLFTKENRIKLRPIFVTDSRGAQRVLTGFIEEARTLLEDHIVEVEQAYLEGVTTIVNYSGSLLSNPTVLEDPAIKTVL